MICRARRQGGVRQPDGGEAAQERGRTGVEGRQREGRQAAELRVLRAELDLGRNLGATLGLRTAATTPHCVPEGLMPGDQNGTVVLGFTW
jgi:hypothetical protein